jgi:hypothetical protein
MATIKVRLSVIALLTFLSLCSAQSHQKQASDDEFGPVVRAYLGYLRDEQEVVDDRVSRREISSTYYRRNSNRIKALRQMAIRLARETHNDYLPELEAVAPSEFGLLFERPPTPATLKVGEVIANKFRYLGSIRSVEIFYVFARLDPYEQSELNERASKTAATPDAGQVKAATRTRRIGP